MNGAIIDIGTNSVRLLCARQQGRKLLPMARKLMSTRLGQGLQSSGKLDPAAIERTIMAVTDMVAAAQRCETQAIWLVATSAVRDAVNQQDFCNECRRQTGLDVEVLSGVQEAKFSYIGAVWAVNQPGRDQIVVDIGGGSTELILGTGFNIGKSTSMQLGAVRLTEMFAPGGIWNKVRVAECQRHICTVLQTTAEGLTAQVLLGVGGTLTSLAAMELKLAHYDPEQIQGYVLDFDTIQFWLERLFSMTPGQRREIIGLQPERADILPAGVLIARMVMEQLCFSTLTVSESDILTGTLVTKLGMIDQQ